MPRNARTILSGLSPIIGQWASASATFLGGFTISGTETLKIGTMPAGIGDSLSATSTLILISRSALTVLGNGQDRDPILKTFSRTSLSVEPKTDRSAAQKERGAQNVYFQSDTQFFRKAEIICRQNVVDDRIIRPQNKSTTLSTRSFTCSLT